jgi:hypothetical protein
VAAGQKMGRMVRPSFNEKMASALRTRHFFEAATFLLFLPLCRFCHFNQCHAA